MGKSSCCLAIFLICSLAAVPATAQLPTATGQQIQLSNPAWKLFIPSTYEQRPGDVADVLIHFHGNPQTVWDNSLFADLNAVIVTVNYRGLSSAYSTPFSDQSLFQSLIDESLTRVRGQPGFSTTLKWDQVGVSSFSAGYGAVREILKSRRYRNTIDALLAADSLYATTASDGTPLDSQMVDYKRFATLAKEGEKTFLFTHSQVLTYTYENTMETGNELMEHLQIEANPVSIDGLGTLEFYRHVKSGKFQLWGASGADGDAHLEHLRYIGFFLKEMPLAHLPSSGGDLDENGAVGGSDLLRWQNLRSSFPWSASELKDWQAAYGTGLHDSAIVPAVPEPESAFSALLATGALLAAMRDHLAGRVGPGG